MPFVAQLLIAAAIAYLLGSIPWAYIAARLKGVEIQQVGTRIAGTANVYRNVGPRWGALVFLGDAAKGATAVAIARALGLDDTWSTAVGVTAVLGHWMPLLGRFPGGLGLATAIGVAIGVLWVPGLIGTAIGLAAVAVMRNTGNSSGVGFAAYVIAAIALREDPLAIVAVVAIALLVLVKARFYRQPR